MHTCHTGQVRQYVCEVPVEAKYVEKVKEAEPLA